MNERALELKVGLVLLAALSVVAAFALFLSDLRLGSGITVNVDYNFSGAIQAGAPVKISGVKVGRVADLVFLGGQPNAQGEPIHVRLVLALEERVRPVLKERTDFFVNTQGLLGENYVEIVPSRVDSPPLADGSVVRGVDPARFDLLFARLYEFLELVSELMKDNRGVVEELVRAGASLVRTLDTSLKANDRDLSRAIQGAAEATELAAGLLRKLDQGLGDPQALAGTVRDVRSTARVTAERLPPLLDKLEASLAELARLQAALGGIDRPRVDAAVADATAALSEAKQVLVDARTISRRVRGGQGTVGLLIQDDEVYDDLKELLRDLKQHPWKLIWKD